MDFQQAQSFRVQRICRDFYHHSNMTRFSQSGALSTRERERERRKKNKRRAKQRRREEIVAEKWQEDPIPRTPRTHAGKHGKNQYGPDCPGQLLIADCGWNKPVRIYDTAMNETRPPRGGTFKIGGWGGGGYGGTDIPFFLRKGSFPWEKLPLELKQAIVAIAMNLELQTAHNLFAVSKEFRQLATLEHIKSYGITSQRTLATSRLLKAPWL